MDARRRAEEEILTSGKNAQKYGFFVHFLVGMDLKKAMTAKNQRRDRKDGSVSSLYKKVSMVSAAPKES